MGETVRAFAKEMLTKKLGSPPDDLKVSINKVADLIVFQLSFTHNGKLVEKKVEWAERRLMAYNLPMTYYIHEIIEDVFEAPSEGAPVS